MNIAMLRACLKGAGTKSAARPKDLRFPRQVEAFYEGRLPNGARVALVEGVGCIVSGSTSR